jgi:hypothetical protein
MVTLLIPPSMEEVRFLPLLVCRQEERETKRDDVNVLI